MFRKLGHEVRLMVSQCIKPYVKTNKNDDNDAEALCEAVRRPSMFLVAIKEVEQQDIQSLCCISDYFPGIFTKYFIAKLG